MSGNAINVAGEVDHHEDARVFENTTTPMVVHDAFYGGFVKVLHRTAPLGMGVYGILVVDDSGSKSMNTSR